MESGVTREWFDSLWNPECWLIDEHMNVVVSMLVYQTRAADPKAAASWSFLNTACWGTLAKSDDLLVDAHVMPFVLGSLEDEWPVSWGKSRRVVGCGHLTTNHWVAYMVSLDDQRITVFDSASSGKACDFVRSQFYSMALHLPALCERAGISPLKDGISQSLNRAFDIVVEGSTPQQPNGYDCGVMVLQFIECIVRGRPLASIVPALCSYQRKLYCCSLFEFGINALNKSAVEKVTS